MIHYVFKIVNSYENQADTLGLLDCMFFFHRDSLQSSNIAWLWSWKCTGDMFTEEQNELIESAAEMLYGLIHVRYILTSKGMAAMVSYLLVLMIVLFGLVYQSHLIFLFGLTMTA